MDDYSEIVFVEEEDPRNAPRSHNSDHRSPSSRPTRVVTVPARPRRPVIVARPATALHATAAVQPAPAQGKAFANLSTGQLVELATMLIAAIMPLPAPPVIQGEAKTDMTNQLAYTSALALHAKRDEQLRTVGALVGKLVG